MNIERLKKQTGILMEEIVMAMQCCRDTYKGEPSNILENQEVLSINGVNTTIGKWKDAIVIGYRGTHSPEWVNNFRFRPVNPPFKGYKGKIHKGFGIRFKLIQPWLVSTLVEELKKVNPGDERDKVKVIFTGHSLGATTAIYSALCIADLSEHFDVYCIVFASPRPGTFRFRRSTNRANVKLISIRNGMDIVCSVPFTWMLYRHPRIYTTMGKWNIFKRLGLYIPFLPVQLKLKWQRVIDHYPQEYTRVLETYIKE